MSRKKFYVTTPIYYVTAHPHVGSLYSTLLADIIARWQELQGNEVFFLTGTDEFGQKIFHAAEKAGKPPQEFVDSFISSYQDTWKKFHIHYTKFIRTTDKEHQKAVQHWICYLQEKGDIYKARYEGWYCMPCEMYLMDKDIADFDISKTKPICPTCSRATTFISEDSYFFKLAKYQDKLLRFYEQNPDFITPKERLREVVEFVKSGLKDLSISRSNIDWGVPFPGDKNHVTYVWADALNNYITAIGYGQKGREAEFKKWWPADVQVIGKDIIRFHAVYWPAFLMAIEIDPPKKLLVHGWIQFNNQKMSKSFGNVIDPVQLYKKYGADEVRYYLARYIAVTHDSPFSIEELQNSIERDLANDLGNLLNRMLTLALNNECTNLYEQHAWSDNAQELRERSWHTIEEYKKYMNAYSYHMALQELWKFINDVNAYFHAEEPWQLVKKNKALFTEVISAVCHSLFTIGVLLWPIMPEKMAHMLKTLGYSPDYEDDMTDALEELLNNRWDRSFSLIATTPLFKKFLQKNASVDKQESEEEFDTFITIDDFAKIELLVGTIQEVEPVKKSDKLFKLLVDFGPQGKRQILSGIQKHFKIDELIGQQGVFVTNLKPRKMLNLESQGMMLLVKNIENGLEIVMPRNTVPNGTRLQ